MGLSCRRFLVAHDGTLFQLANTKFDRMLNDPTANFLPIFAGQRMRMAEVIVELADRNPVRILRNTFAVLTFDGEGRLDSGRFGKQQHALAESALAPVFGVPDSRESVVDAAARFIAQGGSWTPSRALARAIDQAALGRLECQRL